MTKIFPSGEQVITFHLFSLLDDSNINDLAIADLISRGVIKEGENFDSFKYDLVKRGIFNVVKNRYKEARASAKRLQKAAASLQSGIKVLNFSSIELEKMVAGKKPEEEEA